MGGIFFAHQSFCLTFVQMMLLFSLRAPSTSLATSLITKLMVIMLFFISSHTREYCPPSVVALAIWWFTFS